MKISHTILTCAACIALSSAEAFGLDVANTMPGALKSNVGDQAATVTTLKVTGPVNAVDFEFICHDMPALRTLDLSGATVTVYKGAKLLSGRFESAAHVLPEFALIGSGVTSVTLPATLTAIGDGAFSASKITSVTIPATVTTIGESAFSDCAALTSIMIPASVTSIGQGAFNKCTALTSAAVNGAVTEIPARAFAGCSALATVTVPSSLKTIGEEAFAQTGLTGIDLTGCNSLASVGKWAFAGCDKLRNVIMPASVPALSEGAFFHNTSLESGLGAMQGSNATMPDYAYAGNEKMTADGFGDTSVSTIGNYAMQGMSGVSEITLPATLESLGDKAMANMSGLTKIKADGLSAVPAVGQDVWDGVAQGDVELGVHENMADAFRNADQWRDFAVKIITTGIDEVGADDTAASGVKGRFSGHELIVSSLSADITGIQLYDVAGRMYLLPAKSPATLLTFDASAIDDGIYVVRVMLADGTASALKLRK